MPYPRQTASYCLLLWLLMAGGPCLADALEELALQDSPIQEPLSHPDWFRMSFLNLPEDLAESAAEGGRGLILYFGQRHCPYCKALLESWQLRDIREYTLHHFEVVGLDIHGERQLTGMGGESWSEAEYARMEETIFTPSLIFYATDGSEALRLRGYYPPYKFRAALEYVADGHFRNESFRDYLERADPPPQFEPDALHSSPLFSAPPHMLDRSRRPAESGLVVLFEQGECHACDILHGGPLAQPEINELFESMEVVQLDMWSDTPVVTPAGERTTAREWAAQLGLFYTPTLLFFDRSGNEVMRVDSVVGFYRLRNVLDYLLDHSYREGVDFQRWREMRGR